MQAQRGSRGDTNKKTLITQLLFEFVCKPPRLLSHVVSFFVLELMPVEKRISENVKFIWVLCYSG